MRDHVSVAALFVLNLIALCWGASPACAVNHVTSETANTFPYPGTTPAVSANQSSNVIVWAIANSNPAVLYAYDGTNLAHELYDNNQAGSRDQFGPGNKFITPVVANGKVFVGTPTGVAVFGLLP